MQEFGFGDIDNFADDLSLPMPELNSTTDMPAPLDISATGVSLSVDTLAPIPQTVLLSEAELAAQAIANRQDAPIAFVPRKPRATKPKKPLPIPVAQPQAKRQPTTQFKPAHMPSSDSGSRNKISTPPIEPPLSLEKTVTIDQDLKLLALVNESDLGVFSLEEVFDYQVVSPTPAEFITEYYRLIHAMTAKVTLNKLATKTRGFYGLWSYGESDQTVNISSNSVFAYDDIYRYCVSNDVLSELRGLYENKRLHFSQMTAFDVMGAGHGISSAQQATIYLEKMASISLSSTICTLVFRKNMTNVRDWFEKIFGGADLRHTIINTISSAVVDSSKDQAENYKNNPNIFVGVDNRVILFARRYLNPHSSIQLTNNSLKLTVLTFLLSGLSLNTPNLKNINFHRLFTDGVAKHPPLMNSLIQLSYESHRHCYPINELSHL